MADKKYIWDTIDVEEELSSEDLLGGIDPEDIDEHVNEKETQTKQKEKNFVKNRFITFKKRVRFSIILLLIILVGSLFVPFVTIKEVKISETNFIRPSELKVEEYFSAGTKQSLFSLMLNQFKLKSNNTANIDIDFNWQTSVVDITVNEEIPLAKYNGQTYYRFKDKISSTPNSTYQSAELINFDHDQAMAIIEALGYLDYNVLKEIASIEFIGTEQEPELVLMSMNDGNYVLIHINQISDKMPYYNQMVSVTRAQKGDDSRGLFHLNYGDYYEPL